MSVRGPSSESAPEKMSREELEAAVIALRGQLVDRERLADAVPHIVWTTNESGTPTYFNSKLTEYTGLDLAETLRVGGATFVHKKDSAPFEMRPIRRCWRCSARSVFALRCACLSSFASA